MSQFIDPQEQAEILERWMPFGAGGICMWCGSPEREKHEPSCAWVRVRRQHRRKAA